MKKLALLLTPFLIWALTLGLIACGGGEEEVTPTPTPIPMTLYENTEHGFCIEYPDGWTDISQGMGMFLSVEFTDPERTLSAMVSPEYRTEDVILADYVTEMKEYMESTPEFELISEGEVTIGEGISGYEIVGKGDLGTGEVQKFRFVILARGKQGFAVGAMGDTADFDLSEETIDDIVNSFKLLPTYTYVPPTPSAGGTYTSAEYGFSITYPAGWIETTTGQYGEIVDLRAARGLPEVMIRSWSEETTLDKAASKLKEQFSEQVGGYRLLSEGKITLDDGTRAYAIVFEGTMEGYLLTCKYVIVIREADVFVVQGFSMPASFEQDEAVLDEVIYSFHLE